METYVRKSKTKRRKDSMPLAAGWLGSPCACPKAKNALCGWLAGSLWACQWASQITLPKGWYGKDAGKFVRKRHWKWRTGNTPKKMQTKKTRCLLTYVTVCLTWDISGVLSTYINFLKLIITYYKLYNNL